MVPVTFVIRVSLMLPSAIGTCFTAAAWITRSISRSSNRWRKFSGSRMLASTVVKSVKP